MNPSTYPMNTPHPHDHNHPHHHNHHQQQPHTPQTMFERVRHQKFQRRQRQQQEEDKYSSLISFHNFICSNTTARVFGLMGLVPVSLFSLFGGQFGSPLCKKLYGLSYICLMGAILFIDPDPDRIYTYSGLPREEVAMVEVGMKTGCVVYLMGRLGGTVRELGWE